MTQKNIDEEKNWVKDQTEAEGEVLKLQVGESVEGMLIDKFESKKYNAGVYKIKVKDDDIPKVLLGTTILDKVMKTKEIGVEIKIVRLDDSVNQAGQNVQHWETYSRE